MEDVFPRLIREWSVSPHFLPTPHMVVSALRQSTAPQPSHLLSVMREQHGSHKSWQTAQSGSGNDNVQYGAFGKGWSCGYKSRHCRPEDGVEWSFWLFSLPSGDICRSSHASLSVTVGSWSVVIIFSEIWVQLILLLSTFSAFLIPPSE